MNSEQGRGITEDLLTQCRINANVIKVVARKLASAIFSEEERMKGCLSGKRGQALDPAKVDILWENLFSVCPVPRSYRDKAWKAVVIAVDNQTRYMRL